MHNVWYICGLSGYGKELQIKDLEDQKEEKKQEIKFMLWMTLALVFCYLSVLFFFSLKTGSQRLLIVRE
jgi:hypothetical protein